MSLIYFELIHQNDGEMKVSPDFIPCLKILLTVIADGVDENECHPRVATPALTRNQWT